MAIIGKYDKKRPEDDGDNGGKGALRRSEARDILSCTRWIEGHGDDISREVWEKVLQVMRTAPAIRTQLHAAALLADRFDPEPKGATVVNAPTQVNVTWQAPSTSSSPTAPDPSSNGFTVSFDGGTASSPTDDSARA